MMRLAILNAAMAVALLGFVGLQRGLADSSDLVMTFADGKQPVREIFVSPEGSASGGDGTRENPFSTVARALEGVRPGDAVRLLPGEHPAGMVVANVVGTREAPIWMGGVPGEERPVIRGGSQAVHLSRVRFFVLENIEVVGATMNGINCDDGGDYHDEEATRHVLFRNLYVRDTGTGGNQDGLKLSGVRDYFVLDSTFERMSAGGSGIDHVGCHRGVIAHCTFIDMGSNAIQCKGGSEDIQIRQNRFINGGERGINIGGSTGFQFFRPALSAEEPNFEARDIRVVDNFFYGSGAPVAFVGAVECVVAKNTIIEPRNWVVRILQETVSHSGYAFAACGENRFVNNLIYFERSQIRTHLNIGPHTDPSSFDFGHNLWYAFDRPEESHPQLPLPEEGGLYGVDPLFADASNGDYSLLEDSPALGLFGCSLQVTK
ncbi:MAG: right-handed parallel beta-helix repeat-containing protein [Opitutales bacterium]